MANSVSVDELYVSLGLDVSQLDKDFIDVDKTVKQNIARMRAENNRIKIQMDIDTKNLGPAATLTDKLRIQEQGLANQLKIQQQIVALTTAEYAKLAKEKGAAVAASSNLHTSLLKEQRTLADINNQMQKAGQGQKGGLSNMFSGVTDSLKSGGGIKGALSSVSESLLSFAGVGVKAAGIVGAAFAGVTATVTALFQAASYGAQAGEKIYQISQRMHITAQEAATLNNILQLGNVDTQAFTGTMMRLERSVMGVGGGAGAVNQALTQFGVSLTDENGKLLPMNKQLEQLAQGYKNAAASGNEEVFVAQVLGTRGQELIPILQNYGNIKDSVSKVHAWGTPDIEGAHQFESSIKAVGIQWNSIKTAAASALIPIANKLLPLVIDGLNLVIDGIKAVKSAFETITDMPALLQKMGSRIGKLDFNNVYANSKKELEDEKKTAQDAEKEKQKVAQETADNNTALTRTKEKSADELAKEEERKAKEAADATKAAAEETYKATHTTIANEIFDIEKKAETMRQKGVDELTITQYSEAAKAQAIQKFNDETLAQVNSIWQSSLQNRLNDIDKEKKAWQQKGVDEVAATKWAEEQKLSAVRNAALEAIKSDRKRLEEVREAMRQQNSSGVVSGVDANGNKISYNLPQRNAMEQLSAQWVAEDRAKLGIAAGDTFSPELIKMYEQMKKYSAGNLIPGLESGMPAPGMGAQGSKQYNLTGPIQVEINNPMVDNDGQINILADKVADKIKPAVVEALGGGGNGY